MKLLFLCKRRPQGRDLLTRPYGRFFYLPRFLATYKHTVILVLVSYRSGETTTTEMDGLIIHSVSLFPNPLGALLQIYKLGKKTSPDWVIGFSDTYYGILARMVSDRLGAKCLIDAYDNYEAYLPWCKPLHWLWRRAIRKSDAVTCAGPSLKRMFDKFRSASPSEILPMAVDPVGFERLDTESCRRGFNLPVDGKLVGFFGGINRNRDIDTLFRAFELIRETRMDVILVMSGRLSRGIRIPDSVIYLGYVPDEMIPDLYNSVDCVVVLNRDSNFGNYSYPIKLYEAMACDVPVIVSRTESTEWIMKDHPELLVAPGDPVQLSRSIIQVIDGTPMHYRATGSWQDGAGKMEAIMLNKLKSGSA